MFCLAAAGVAWLLSLPLSGLSPLILAILLGVVVCNVTSIPRVLLPGLGFTSKKLLRLGIVFLGLKLVLSDIWALGWKVLLAVVVVVAVGIAGTVVMGRVLGVERQLTLLVACGFSICGAAAVAGVAGATDPHGKKERETITAVALVVLFGTLMIPVVPLLSHAMGLSDHSAGVWGGACVHEIAQVVAVGGVLGGEALTVAVIVKLARVLMLAPVIAVVGLVQRRTGTTRSSDGSAPPIVPLFIVGFLAMVVLRSFVPLPSSVLSAGSFLQTALLGAAMFGLGCGVKVRELVQVGGKPFVLAALATVLMAVVALLFVMWVG